MAQSLCGSTVQSKRSFLATAWGCVNLLALCAFISAFVFTLSSAGVFQNNNQYYYYQQQQQQNNRNEEDMQISITSRAMAFAAMWTALLSIAIGIFGTVVLGFQFPGGGYYTCCHSSVAKTTPLVIGIFIGCLLMFANLTLVTAVLFGEFEIRDYREGEPERGGEEGRNNISRSSFVFSLLCIFLTVLYAGFAAMVYSYSTDLAKENEDDYNREDLESPYGQASSTSYQVYNENTAKSLDSSATPRVSNAVPPPPVDTSFTQSASFKSASSASPTATSPSNNSVELGKTNSTLVTKMKKGLK